MAEEKKRPSVAEMLAMARKADGAKPAEGAAPAADKPVDAAPPAAKKPAAPSGAAPLKGAIPKPGAAGRPSVADMLAMARSKPAAAEAPAAEAKPAPAAKPAAEKKPVEKAPPAAKPAPTNKDTASVLAAARAGAKPGPVTKAEAEIKQPTADVAAAKAKLAVTPPVMPPKPEYAKPKAKADTDQIERVGFIGLVLGSFFAIGNTALAVTGGLASLGLARYLFPNILTEPPSKFKIGFKDAFGADKVDTRFTNQFGVWVVNSEYNGQRQIFALKTVCTHLGCTPNWLEAEQKFKCPCHGSGFYKDGINFEGPAPRPLERYAIRIADDGQLEIDKSKTFQEEMGQWADSSCFVNV